MLVESLSLLALAVSFTYVFAKMFVNSPAAWKDLRDKHALITGGSKGIGRAIAMELTTRGCHVTIVARNRDKLKEVLEELQWAKMSTGQILRCFQHDVTGGVESARNLMKLAELYEGSRLPIDILINNAGGSSQGAFEELSEETHMDQMRLNYLSAVDITRPWVEGVKKSWKRGDERRLVFVSSQAGLIGLYGYSAYSPAKFALRGFAEVLQSELKPFGVAVTIAFPPNTETEGFAEELKSMPRETLLISETAGRFSAEAVAKKIVKDMSSGRFNCQIGLDGFMLGTLAAAMSPVSSAWEAVQQIWTVGVFRLVALFYINSFQKIVETCAREKKAVQ